MYVVVFKIGARCAWRVNHKVFGDREKADAVADNLRDQDFYRVHVVYIDIPEKL